MKRQSVVQAMANIAGRRGSAAIRSPLRCAYRHSQPTDARQDVALVRARTRDEARSPLHCIVGRPLLLKIAIDRAARLLEEIVGVPRWPEFKDEAAQHSRVRRSCLVYLMFRRADPIRLNWQHLRALPRCVNTYIPPILNRLSLFKDRASRVPLAIDQ